jgi:hypothetical protein
MFVSLLCSCFLVKSRDVNVTSCFLELLTNALDSCFVSNANNIFHFLFYVRIKLFWLHKFHIECLYHFDSSQLTLSWHIASLWLCKKDKHKSSIKSWNIRTLCVICKIIFDRSTSHINMLNKEVLWRILWYFISIVCIAHQLILCDDVILCDEHIKLLWFWAWFIRINGKMIIKVLLRLLCAIWICVYNFELSLIV